MALQKFSCLNLSFSWRGFGIPPIEAIAAGGKSIVQITILDFEYVNGTFDSYNVEDIEKTFKEATKEIDLDHQANLRETVIKKFSWKKTAKNSCHHYNSFIHENFKHLNLKTF